MTAISSARDTAVRSPRRSDRSTGSSFVRNVTDLLDRVEYRRCESGEDLEAIYRLRYKAYRAHDFVPRAASLITSDEYDDTPNSYRFGVFIDDQLISTVRIHHLSREQPKAPIMGAFGDVMGPRIDRGETFTNPTMLAADPDCAHGLRAIPYVTLRLAVIANEHFDTTGCVCVIREEHTAFYRRIFGSVQVGEPRAYPPITIPLMLYDSECAINMQKTLDRFPFFKSKPSEQRMLFGRPNRGDLAPLTILPTAKYLQPQAA